MNPIVEVDYDKARQVGAVLAKLAPTSALDFCTIEQDGKRVKAPELFPQIDDGTSDRQKLNFFPFAMSQNYGFWYSKENRYERPIYGLIDGKEEKGSTLLFKMLKRAFDRDPNMFEPIKLARMSWELFNTMMSDDIGVIPFEDIGHRYDLMRAYGQWFVEHQLSPISMVTEARAQNYPDEVFLESIMRVPGFNGDKYAKKALLFQMALALRPERFLPGTSPLPLIDYHNIRVTLRQGAVKIRHKDTLRHLRKRQFVSAQVHDDIRAAVYLEKVAELEASGLSKPIHDYAVWMSREYCPEMSKPQCDGCTFSEVCDKKIDMFQPVFYTDQY